MYNPNHKHTTTHLPMNQILFGTLCPFLARLALFGAPLIFRHVLIPTCSDRLVLAKVLTGMLPGETVHAAPTWGSPSGEFGRGESRLITIELPPGLKPNQQVTATTADGIPISFVTPSTIPKNRRVRLKVPLGDTRVWMHADGCYLACNTRSSVNAEGSQNQSRPNDEGILALL